MRKLFRTSQNIASAIIISLAIILIGRLFYLTVITGSEWRDAANKVSIKGIYNPSPRGSIYDRNGKVLATNQQIFTVKMRAGDLKNEEINEVALKLIRLLEENGEEYDLNFPIKYEDGNYYFTYQEEINKWLQDNNFSIDTTAEEAFYALKERLGIEGSDRFAIQKEMQTKKNVYPPISVKEMKFSQELAKKDFLSGYGIKDESTSADEVIKTLKKNYKIDDNLSQEDMMKVLAVRNQLKTLGYQKYMSVTIAKNVKESTVVAVEEKSSELKGVEVSSESKRYYPNGHTASHILGYMGKISADEKAEYEKKGYNVGGLVGKQGIESKYEHILRGQAGTDVIRVNAKGGFAGNVTSIPAKKGKDVYLTIDADLQKIAEENLAKNINACRAGSSFSSEFGTIGLKASPNAKSGAVVAMEVETGDILAMASYPDYDPNLFAEGISSEDWESLQSSNPRDSLSDAPLLNMATMTAVQPGSTYKPVTAYAALETGLNPDQQMKDDGFVKLGDRTFACSLWNKNKGTHGWQDLYKAMQVSCNFYFYGLITNKDWHTGDSLGLKGMSIDKVIDTGKNFGLGELTGIQISEVNAGVPSEKRKIETLKASLRNSLYANAEVYFEEEVYSNSKRLKKDIDTIVDWMDIKGITYAKLKDEYLPEVGVKPAKYQEVIEMTLYEYFNQAQWSTGDAFNVSIGQGDNAYTPLQMARYMSILGNKGKKMDANLVMSIEDEGDIERKPAVDTGMDKKHLETVLEAMHHVTASRGEGLYSHYANFPWKVAVKTGTAQKAGFVNPPSEVEYIKSHLSSFGNMSWDQVEAEMKRLMKEYPKTYTTEDIAVRRAVINLSGGELSYDSLDRYKSTYDEFAWIVAVAPKDNPKIAVACMIPQGQTGGNADPVVREIIGQYLKGLDKNYKDFSIVETIN